ncbi:MAG: hypothetical protein ACYCWW_07815 [Deltaproteobacteria bacterium]
MCSPSKRPFALLGIVIVAGGCFVRPPDPPTPDAGPIKESILALNGGLAAPGTPTAIAPAPVALTTKFYLRKERGSAPDCYYGIFVADPAQQGQPNNGLLLVALGDMNKINNDASLGGEGRTSCPSPPSYQVGGPLLDATQPGDQLQVDGILAPYCETYNASLGQCDSDPFPEFQVSSMSKLGTATPPAPTVVDPSQIADGSSSAIIYAGNLVEVQNVTVEDPTPDPYGDLILEQGGLWVDPLESGISIFAQQGTPFNSITGILHYQFGHWKLRPRTTTDIVSGQ